MRPAMALLLLWSISACSADFRSLYDGHDWFRLRDLIQSTESAPLFYRGAVAAAFGHDDEAETDFRKVIKSMRGSWEAGQAKDSLALIKLRRDKWKTYSRRLPDQQVVKREPAKVHAAIDGQAMWIPLSINGKNVNFALDTGAATCVVSESEAKRLQLKLIRAKGDAVDGWTAKSMAVRHVGIARQMVIGGIELRNVFFIVMPDERWPFADSPEDRRGIVGLPVLQALETISWDRDGNFEFGFPSAEGQSNLCFDGAGVSAEVELNGKPLIFGLDTGSPGTVMHTRFQDQFPEMAKAGEKQKRRGGGMSGEIDYEAIVLPTLELSIGGVKTILENPEIDLTPGIGGGHSGTLGLGLLNQSARVTIDFRSMRLVLDPKERPPQDRAAHR